MQNVKEDKFKEFLKKIFQFNDKDKIDLDFGVYKVFKRKQNEIQNFIESELKNIIESLVEKHLKQEDKKKIDINTKMNIVFEHILSFFERFYDKGDFYPVPNFRQSKNQKGAYQLDYNGEEVVFYWVSKNQHHVKSIKNIGYYNYYKFELNGKEIIFQIDNNRVDEIKGNQKETRNIFFVKTLEESQENNQIIVKLAFRKNNNPHSDEAKFEAKELFEILKDKLHLPAEAKKDLQFHMDKFKNLRDSDFFIHKNLKRFLTKELEYFIKNEVVNLDNPDTLKEAILTKEIGLKIIEFLSSMEDLQLLLWEKKKFAYDVNYVITLDRLKDIKILKDIEGSGGFERQKEEWKELGFISDLNISLYELFVEWNKIKDLKIKRDYLTNKQKKVWGALFKSDSERLESIFNQNYKFLRQIIKRLQTIFSSKQSKLFDEKEDKLIDDVSKLSEIVENYKKYKTLPIDTKYFTHLKYKILEQFDNLDEELDGILIRSDNWQALNTILPKYKEKIQTIYIDPPFNTGRDFLYKDNYQDATWLTLMQDRLQIAKKLLNTRGNLFLHLDENADHMGKVLLYQDFLNIKEIIWNTNATKDENSNLFSYKSFGIGFTRQHDVIFQATISENSKFFKLWKTNNNQVGWLDIISVFTGNKRNLDNFRFYIEKYENNILVQVPIISNDNKIYPVGDVWNDIYSFMQSEVRTSEGLGFQTQKPENLLRRIIQSSTEPNDIVLDFFLGSGTTTAVAHKLKRKYIGIEISDYFNEIWIDEIEIENTKLEDMKNKFVKIAEKGDKKSKVLVKKLGILGRMKNVVYGDAHFDPLYTNEIRKPHLTNDINWQGGGFFKYLYLEQYEDTLENVNFNSSDSIKEKTEILKKLQESFPELAEQELLNLLSNIAIDNSKSLLMTVEDELLANPFEFKLIIDGQEKVMDLIETYNLIKPVHVRKIFEKDFSGKKYIFVISDKEAVIWREVKEFLGCINQLKEKIKEEEKFIRETLKDIDKYKDIYINAISQHYPKNFLDGKAKELLTDFRRLLVKDFSGQNLTIDN